MSRELEEVEEELNELQLAYIEEEDEVKQIEIVSRFTKCLKEATDIDQVDRIALGITINNWVRE